MRLINFIYISLAATCLEIVDSVLEESKSDKGNYETGTAISTPLSENKEVIGDEQVGSIAGRNRQFRTVREAGDDIEYPIKPVQVTVVRKTGEKEQNSCCNYQSRSFNDLAQVLAGLGDITKFNCLAYKKYSKNITKKWQQINANCFEKIRKWQQENLGALNPYTTIFYPFGGPDIAHAVLLFPNANQYILVGQENPGNSQTILGSCSSEALNNLEKSEDNFFKKGYFVTSYMATDLNTRSMKGVLPIALLTLAKFGYEIISAENLSLFSGKIDSLKITFKNQVSDIKALIYIKCDLTDASEKLNKLLDYVSDVSKNEFVVFLKSSSYSLHRKEFSKIRKYIVDKCAAILQDDTGIRFKDIDKTKYVLKLFGSYAKPALPVFSDFMQMDLADAYKKMKPKPLDFYIGYIGDRNVQLHNYQNINLQLYIRNDVAKLADKTDK